MKHPARRIERVSCWCRRCWHKLAFDFEWSDLQGMTLEDLRQSCNDRHKKDCPSGNPDVRLGNATKTRR